MSQEFDRLLHSYLRDKAIHDCENVIGRFTYFMTTFLAEKLVGLWADRDDCTLEMPFGCYDGRKGVERFFREVMGDRSDPDVYEKIRGVMCFTTLDTQILEVAEDRQTARGSWFGPGVETFGNAATCEEARGTGYWSWTKTAVDFIFDNGEWKLWHVKVHQIFRSEYFTPWTEMPAYTGWVLGDAKADREPARRYTVYDPDAPQWDDIPAPLPYRSFEDVAPGYGYVI